MKNRIPRKIKKELKKQIFNQNTKIVRINNVLRILPYSTKIPSYKGLTVTSYSLVNSFETIYKIDL